MPSDGALPRSSFVDVDGPVHVADYGGDPQAGTIVCLHGLANSHVAWMLLCRVKRSSAGFLRPLLRGRS
jgi:pimeloyl-ACP methyl ester carboxylesterase